MRGILFGLSAPVNPVGIDFGSAFCKAAFCNEQGAALTILDLSSSDRGDLFPRSHKSSPENQEAIPEAFRDLSDRIQRNLQQEAGDIVLTVPDFFEASRRELWQKAAGSSGWNPLAVITETEACAVFHLAGCTQRETLFFYLLGADSCKTAVAEMTPTSYRVLATSSKSGVGGAAMDRELAKSWVNQMEEDSGQRVAAEDPLWKAAEAEAQKARHALSHRGNYDVKIFDAARRRDFSKAFSRFELQESVKDVVTSTIPVCEEALQKAKLSKKQLDRVIFLGGTSRMPLIQNVLQDFFQKKPEPAKSIDHAVAQGAAIYGWRLKQKL